MNTGVEKRVQKELRSLADESYREFHSALIPTVEKSRILGVRVPVLRKFAKTFGKTEDKTAFLQALPHETYDENCLHALLLNEIRDYDEAERKITEFLPHIDNWAVCDMLTAPALKKENGKRQHFALSLLQSSHPYTVRYGMETLMRYDLGETFDTAFADAVAAVSSEEYYVIMMQAWYFATALAEQETRILPYFEKKILSPAARKKAVQKAKESYRIKKELKLYLETIKHA